MNWVIYTSCMDVAAKTPVWHINNCLVALKAAQLQPVPRGNQWGFWAMDGYGQIHPLHQTYQTIATLHMIDPSLDATLPYCFFILIKSIYPNKTIKGKYANMGRYWFWNIDLMTFGSTIVAQSKKTKRAHQTAPCTSSLPSWWMEYGFKKALASHNMKYILYRLYLQITGSFNMEEHPECFGVCVFIWIYFPTLCTGQLALVFGLPEAGAIYHQLQVGWNLSTYWGLKNPSYPWYFADIYRGIWHVKTPTITGCCGPPCRRCLFLNISMQKSSTPHPTLQHRNFFFAVSKPPKLRENSQSPLTHGAVNVNKNPTIPLVGSGDGQGPSKIRTGKRS